MVNNGNYQKIEQTCECGCEDRFVWPRIKASTASSITPPVSIPNGTILPIVNRYFYIVTADIHLTNGATINANLFWDDNGNQVTAFTIFQPNGYVNLFINGVMQEGGIYTITPASLVLNADNATIYRGTPIIIESLGFINQTT